MLTLQYLPYHELIGLDSDTKLKKILKLVKEDKIVLIEGKLAVKEETELITQTLEQIDKRFRGIEICSVDCFQKNTELITRLRTKIANLLLGRTEGLTIIGPATIVKEIKKDPNKIELFTLDRKKKLRRRNASPMC
ncbi:MAG TPA: DUF2073 domain-containing protein [Candidatus Nanoarchaeia archaeon]|nr:DUF2073 domain-containing protein [Candidatus Nanoarchaeia archaeon]